MCAIENPQQPTIARATAAITMSRVSGFIKSFLLYTGPIIFESKLKINKVDTALTLQKRMAVEIEDKLYKLLPLFIENKLLNLSTMGTRITATRLINI